MTRGAQGIPALGRALLPALLLARALSLLAVGLPSGTAPASAATPLTVSQAIGQHTGATNSSTTPSGHGDLELSRVAAGALVMGAEWV